MQNAFLFTETNRKRLEYKPCVDVPGSPSFSAISAHKLDATNIAGNESKV